MAVKKTKKKTPAEKPAAKKTPRKKSVLETPSHTDEAPRPPVGIAPPPHDESGAPTGDRERNVVETWYHPNFPGRALKRLKRIKK